MLSLSLALHKCAKNTSINLWNAYYFDFLFYAYSYLRSFLRNILDASNFRTGYGGKFNFTQTETPKTPTKKLSHKLQWTYVYKYDNLFLHNTNFKIINKKQYATNNVIILKKSTWISLYFIIYVFFR